MNEDDSLFRAINEQIELVPYNAAWPSQFEIESARLMELFPMQIANVQHFGSTAIPGMPAKPIIDILVGVQSMKVAEQLVEPLLENGYGTSAEFNATLVGRLWFMRWQEGRRTHHLHVVELGGMEWSRKLLFRDILRTDPVTADRYAQLKLSLAGLYKDNRENYTSAKTAFISAVLRNV